MSSQLIAGLFAFLTTGLLQAMYGPAFPHFQERFLLSASSVALIASAHFAGTAIGPLLAGALLNRFSVQHITFFSLGLLIAGVMIVGLSPWWSLALLGAVIGGIGCGSANTAVNATYATTGTRTMNLVNAFFGIGSVLSPLAVAWFVPIASPYLLCAALAAITIVVMTRFRLPTPVMGSSSQTQAPLWLLSLFCLLLGGYVALEVGFGAWIGEHIRSLNASATLVVSAYWAGLTVSRLLIGLIPNNYQPRDVMLTSFVGATLLSGLTFFMPQWAVFLYPCIGFLMGPLFSTSLVWMSPSISAKQFSVVMVAGCVGGILSPSVVGWLIEQTNLSVLPLSLAVLGMVLIGCTVALRRHLA